MSSRRDFMQLTGLAASGMLATGAAADGATPAQQANAAPGRERVTKTRLLRNLLARPGVLVIPECYNVLTGLVTQSAGWEVVSVGGSVMAGMNLGLPDLGISEMSEFVEISGQIARALDIPVVSDADQAGETSLNVYRTIKSFERAGVAAVHIEDTLNPKHASGGGSRPAGTGIDQLQPIPEMVERLTAAVEARTDPDFVIIGRTEALLYGMPLDEAVRRGVAYAKAGIDLFWANGGGSRQIIETLAREVPVPIMAINQPLRLVKDTPLKVDMFTTSSMGWAAKLHDTMVRQLKEHGEYVTRPEALNINDLIRLPDYAKLAERWAAATR